MHALPPEPVRVQKQRLSVVRLSLEHLVAPSLAHDKVDVTTTVIDTFFLKLKAALCLVYILNQLDAAVIFHAHIKSFVVFEKVIEL